MAERGKVVTEMAKVAALFKEKKWLENFVRHDQVKEALVQCIDLELLNQNPIIDNLLPGRWSKRIILFDEAGEFIVEVGVTNIFSPRFNLFKLSTWFPSPFGIEIYDNRETVASALIRSRQAEKVFHAVMLEESFNPVGPRPIKLTFYKPPKTFTLRSWLEEVHRRADESLTAEFYAIDNLAKAK